MKAHTAYDMYNTLYIHRTAWVRIEPPLTVCAHLFGTDEIDTTAEPQSFRLNYYSIN